MATKLIRSDNAKGTVEPVNIELAFTFRKESGQIGKYNWSIAFYKEDPVMEVKPVRWKYETEAERDCDYNQLIANYTESINVTP